MYNNCGNIVKQKTFAFSLKDEELLEGNSFTEKEYIYDGDKLVSFNGQACEYDEVGNPTTYRGKIAYWGYDRRLDGYDDNLHNYDGAGNRTTNSGVGLTYDVNGNLVRTDDGLEFFYDHTGVSSVKYDGIIYFYRKDIFGNIIALIDNILGEVAVKYIYDAWGNHKVVDGNGNEITDENHIGNLNPFRYRSYFYDTGAKFYYLKSRDYDPETGRFLTTDSIEYIDPNSINGLNLYAYCANNPVMNIDPSGHWAISASLVTIFKIAAAVLIIGGVLSVVENETHVFSKAAVEIGNKVESSIDELGEVLISFVDSIVPKNSYNNYQEHHIVAKKSWKAAPARYFLKQSGIGVDEPENKVLIKNDYHRVMHTNIYYGIVNTSVFVAYVVDKEEGIRELLKMYSRILGGLGQ